MQSAILLAASWPNEECQGADSTPLACAGDEAVDRLDILGHPLDGEVVQCPSATILAHPATALGLVDEGEQVRRQLLGVVRFPKQPGLPVFYELGCSTSPDGDDRLAHRHRLDEGQRAWLSDRGEGEDIRSGEYFAYVAAPPCEDHLLLQSSGGHLPSKCFCVGLAT